MAITQAAQSEIGGAFREVIVPAGVNAGRNGDSVSAVVRGRTSSSCPKDTFYGSIVNVTGAISRKEASRWNGANP